MLFYYGASILFSIGFASYASVVQQQQVDADERESSRSRSRLMISAFEEGVNNALPFLKKPYKVSRRLQTIFETLSMADSKASKVKALLNKVIDVENRTESPDVPSTAGLLSTDEWKEIANFLWSDPHRYKKQNALRSLAITDNVLKAFPMLTDSVMDPAVLDRFVYDETTGLIDVNDDCFTVGNFKSANKCPSAVEALQSKQAFFTFYFSVCLSPCL
jgi:hypothetical protein